MFHATSGDTVSWNETVSMTMRPARAVRSRGLGVWIDELEPTAGEVSPGVARELEPLGSSPPANQMRPVRAGTGWFRRR